MLNRVALFRDRIELESALAVHGGRILKNLPGWSTEVNHYRTVGNRKGYRNAAARRWGERARSCDVLAAG
jgi:hypothetical protein